ncbi:hypothetical protein [Neobacillus citreus]|uniref:Uncharacterized protein n=1 Tax=Neobacillus citreus TaxID=2833578 RepID=A0A942YC83_9BACI|nr:hypothetical protein [Neobacillus citreus]MCH6267165.1 hypothetical protein [Neobacillus citreus]
MASVLFGTVEYYEGEIVNYLSNKYGSDKEDVAKKVFALLEKEILNSFLFEDTLRIQCLHNLLKAFGKVSKKSIVMIS